MIVRNCAADLDRCLGSVREYVDEVVLVDTEPGGSTDGTREVATKHQCEIRDFPWVDDFSAARNFSFQQCRFDRVIWLDSDDIVENAPSLIDSGRRIIGERGDTIYVRYDYEFDKAGHCTTRLWRERIADRRKFEWKAPIHECMIGKWRFDAAYLKPEYGLIRHTRKREDEEAARVRLERNLKMLESEFNKGSLEIRLWFYWGNTLVGLHRWEEALHKYAYYCQHTGNPSERYAAMVAMSECHRLLRRPDDAMQMALRAVAQEPGWPSGYLHLAESAMWRGDFPLAERWAREALLHLQNQQQEMVYNPKALEARPHVVLAVSLANTGRLQQAEEHLTKAEAYFPDDDQVADVRRQFNLMSAESTQLSAADVLWRQLDQEGNVSRKALLLAAMPDSIVHHPLIEQRAPRQRSPHKRTVAFWCPKLGMSYGPSSIRQGIGGSEEAVINMSRELAKRNWNVEVYCQASEPGRHDGVFWYDADAFSGEDTDVLVWWRAPEAPIQTGFKATCSYMWLHDTPVKDRWIPNYEQLFDRVMFLTQYHRSLFPWVQEEHAWYTQNATDPSLWVEPANEPGRLIYSSCPSRGLHYLLRWWPYIRELAPQATLDIYYGWNMWAMRTKDVDQAFRARFDEVERSKSQPGVTWHDRVGQDVLAKAFSRAQLWAYPCWFPEISCITAMKAQLHGVMPIVVGKRNALEETVQHGVKLDVELEETVGQKIFMDTIVEHLNDPGKFSQAARQEMVAWARKQYQWSLVADDWDRQFRIDIENKSSQGRRFSIEKGRAPAFAMT